MKTTTFHTLIREHEIRIPLIQRDYAQGREDARSRRVRRDFLRALKEALTEAGVTVLDNRFVTLERGGKNGLRIREQTQPLDRVLARLLELPQPAKLLFCGGQDAIAAQREQWNDGANTLCLSPGVVVTYDRNQVTNRLLEDNGIRVLSIPSSELSRGRGGPRCMSMPLVREAQM